jgi:FtsH-binding integral membrane protein
MKYLLYLDAALAALGVAMTLPMGFVCLVYSLMPDAQPGMRQSIPNLLVLSLCFVALAVSGGLATYGLSNKRGWNWAAQMVLAVVVAGLFLIVPARLQGA